MMMILTLRSILVALKSIPGYSSTSLPTSAEGSGGSDSTFGDDSNSGGRSSSASMNKVSKAKLYGLFIGLGLLVPLSVEL